MRRVIPVHPGGVVERARNGGNRDTLRDRRGFIPTPESPREKIDRIRRQKYQGAPLEHIAEKNESEFFGYDLGNRKLPAFKHKKEIIDTIENNRISVLTGQTGSGKTTQLAQFALEAGYDRVVYLQPRRVNVDNNSDRVTEELSEKIGRKRAKQVCGMAHSERSTITKDTIIQFMTSGTFTKKFNNIIEEWRDERVLVVADETHENNVETEFATALAARQVEASNDWRLVLASATPDNDLMTDTYKAINGGGIPVVTIEGRPHDLEYFNNPRTNVVSEFLDERGKDKKTLIFVHGKRTINDVIAAIKKGLSYREHEKIKFFKLHADISPSAQKAIFNMELDPDEIAVIVSTPAGQSGITIPGVSKVICSGLVRSPELDDEGAEGLPVQLCTKAQIIQQGGRAGRDVDGARVVLTRPFADGVEYPFVALEDREDDMPAEIYNSNITGNVLDMICSSQDLHKLNGYLKHPVSAKSINDVYELLDKLGAIDDNYHATSLGRRMNRFPLKPELSRAMVGVENNPSLRIKAYSALIAASLNAGGVIDTIEGRGRWKDYIRPTTNDDFIAQLDLMLLTYRGQYSDSWRGSKYLKDLGLNTKKTLQAHHQAKKILNIINLNIDDVDITDVTEDEEYELRDLFLRGMPDLIYRRKRTEDGRGVYENVWGYDSPIERRISNRSILSIGKKTVDIVVGYPRWYEDDRGRVHSVIESGFDVSRDQLRRVFKELAMRSLESTVARDGHLVIGGQARLGDLSVGRVKTRRVRAESDHDRVLLVEDMMVRRADATEALRNLGLSDEEIREKALEMVKNMHSVHELDNLLWSIVATRT